MVRLLMHIYVTQPQWVKVQAGSYDFMLLADDWLVALLPANQMPGLKNLCNFLVTQAPGLSILHIRWVAYFRVFVTFYN